MTTAAPQAANPMRKIIVMVGIAIVVFLAFTTYSVRKSLQSDTHISAIKGLYFPVLQGIEANIVRVDKLEELFMRSVMTGDRDALDEAATLHKDAVKAFDEISRIYPERSDDIAKLRSGLTEYHDKARAAAENFLRTKEGDVPAQARLAKALAELRGSIATFREASYGSFVQTLADTQSAVKLNLYMGIALGVMNLCFMGVLVFFVRRNVTMMGVIAEQNATLELRVAERTAQLRQKTQDIQAMLQNMPQGVLTLQPGGVIHPEYSAYLETILDTSDIAGKALMELLFTDTDLGADALSQVDAAIGACIGEDEMNFEFNSHVLVTAFDKRFASGETKSLELSWSPICDAGGTIEKLMLCVRDVTELKRLAHEAGAQKRELEIIGEVLKLTQEKFHDFTQSAQQFLLDNETLISQTQEKDATVVGLLFRNMHTIKGNARTYGLRHLTHAVHEAEQAYDRLRQEGDAAWEPNALLDQLAAVKAIVAEYQHVNDETLGRKGPGRRGRVERLHHILLDITESMPSLARELGKEPPNVVIADQGLSIRSQAAGTLRNVFTHLFRNAMDHGLETAADRQAAGKAGTGCIELSAGLEGDTLRMHLRDDGRGLAVGRIRRKAIEKGLINADTTLAPEAVAQLIFAPGFSTAEQLTEVSGRGVGMDAVKGFLTAEGGDVEVRFRDADASAEWRPFELVISLPGKFAAA